MFQSFKIQLLDLISLFEKLSETEKEDYYKLKDFKIGNKRFNSSILNFYGLRDESHELEQWMLIKKSFMIMIYSAITIIYTNLANFYANTN